MIKTFTNKTESEMVSMTHQDLKILILRIVSAVLSLSEDVLHFGILQLRRQPHIPSTLLLKIQSGKGNSFLSVYKLIQQNR